MCDNDLLLKPDFLPIIKYRILYISHPEARGWGGGSYSKKLGELSLVDSDSTRREEHAYIGHSSG